MLIANVELPQMFTGTTILAGNVALQGVIDGRYSWQQIAYGPIKRKDHALTLDRFTKAHNAFDITLDINTGSDGSIKGRLARVLTAARDNICVAAFTLGRDIAPDIEDAFELFEPRRRAGVRPEVVAVGGILAAAATGLKSDAGRATAKRLREALRIHAKPGVSAEDHARATDELRAIRPALSHAVSVGIYTELPAIRAQYGRNIPVEAVEAFVHGAVQAPTVLDEGTDFFI
jgi:hypothetical protein